MKAQIRRKIFLDLKLDSSEAVMFNQGGKHSISLNPDEFSWNIPDREDCEDDENPLSNKFELEISVQIDKKHQGRHEFIMKSAAEHMQRKEDENGC
jgi:hypothetical protein